MSCQLEKFKTLLDSSLLLFRTRKRKLPRGTGKINAPGSVSSNSRWNRVASQLCRSSWPCAGNTDPCLAAPSTPTLASRTYITFPSPPAHETAKARAGSFVRSPLWSRCWHGQFLGRRHRRGTILHACSACPCLSSFGKTFKSSVLVLITKTSLSRKESQSLKMISLETCKDYMK